MEDRIALAQDLLATGMTPTAVVEHLASELGLTTRTAQRVTQRARCRSAVEAQCSIEGQLAAGSVVEMADTVAAHVQLALAEGDRKGAASLIGQWRGLLQLQRQMAPSRSWDAALAAAACEELPASMPF
jgi:hypothetical protein